MKRMTMTLVCLLQYVAGALAGHWTVNPYSFRYDMTAYITLMRGSQVVGDYAGYEVAAFCGDECRGVAKVLALEDDSKVLYLRVYSNQLQGEIISLKAYKASTNEILLIPETVEFASDAMLGTPGEPLLVTVEGYMKGDVDGDGEITAQDASLVLQLVAGKISAETEGVVYEAADVDGDDEVTAQDASLILQHVAGKITIEN